MLRLVMTGLLLTTLAGCCAGHGIVVRPPGGAVANLALGRTGDQAYLSEAYAYRSSWPSVTTGHLFDDVSTFTEVIYDDQSFYDDIEGGGYIRESVSVRTGVLVR